MTISVVTAALPSRDSVILGAYESLRAQVLPSGWDWEWVVQEDGVDDSLASVMPDDPRVRYGWNGVEGGPAITRNLGLTRAMGSLVRVLDDDDRLMPNALGRDIAILESDHSLGWMCSRAVDVRADGALDHFPDLLPEGRVESGALLEAWRSLGGTLPVVPGTVTVRTEILRAVGGWMGLPASEDVGMLMTVASLYAGYYSSEASLYRVCSETQTTAQEWAKSEHNRALRLAAVEQRVAAVTELLSARTAAGSPGAASLPGAGPRGGDGMNSAPPLLSRG